MDCMSCGEHIPDDSIFCPECGARQDLSRAGGFTAPNSVGLGGQEVTGGRSFGVVSGEAIRQQREMSQKKVCIYIYIYIVIYIYIYIYL